MAHHLTNSLHADPNAPKFANERMKLLLHTDLWRYKSYWNAISKFNETTNVKKIFSARLRNEPVLHSGLVQKVSGFKDHTSCAHVHTNGPLLHGCKLSKNACLDLQNCGCSPEEICHFGAYVRSVGKVEQPLTDELRKKVSEHFELYQHHEIWDTIKAWPETAKTVLHAKLDMVKDPDTIAKLQNLSGPNRTPLNEFFQKISLNLQPEDIPEIDATYFEPSIGSKIAPISEINNYIRELKHVKGALGKDGAITDLLQGMTINDPDPGALNRARGSLYHLAKAYQAKIAGKNIIQLEADYTINGNDISYDIEFDNLLVECKNTLWNEFKNAGDLTPDLLSQEKVKDINKLLKNLNDKNLFAQSIGKEFIVYSNHYIPNNLKSWMKNNKVCFTEGDCSCIVCL